MPLQETVSVQSRGSNLKQKLKKFLTRAGAMLVVLIVALTCAVPALSASAVDDANMENVSDSNSVVTPSKSYITTTGIFSDYSDWTTEEIKEEIEKQQEIVDSNDKYSSKAQQANEKIIELENELKERGDLFTLYDIVNGINGTALSSTSISTILEKGAAINFEYDTGVTIKDLIEDAGNALKAWIAPAVASSYAGAIVHMDETVYKSTELLTRSLSGTHTESRQWNTNNLGNSGLGKGTVSRTVTVTDEEVNKTIYDVCQSICDNIILPIAGVMIAFVFAYEIYEIVCERNNMNDIGSGTFIQLILKMAIAILVVVNAWALTQAVFSLGQTLVTSATNLPELSGASGLLEQVGDITDYGLEEGQEGDALQWYFCYLICMDKTLDFGSVLVMFLQGIIINIGMYIVSLIVSVIIYVRMIEIYLYMSLSPLPLATLTNRTWSMVGMNYIRAIIALALQAIIIYLCLALFNVMVTNVITKIGEGSSDLTTQMWSVIGYSVILVFCLFKSGGLSKSIMNAH